MHSAFRLMFNAAVKTQIPLGSTRRAI